MFTLIYGDKVKQTPGKKVVPAAEFSKVVEAQGVLEKIREDADRYRKETAEEIEKLKEIAQREGFEAGLKKWAKKIDALEKQIADVEKKVKAKLVPIALESAKKIVGRELKSDPETVADIVAQNLKAVTQHRSVAIYCNRADLEGLEKNRERFRGMFERLDSLTIQEREGIEEGACVIETEAGIINAHWNQVWGALEQVLRGILMER
ncbi:MAG: HrpE/YscL family type III secretion apparatus protein [Parachlamydiales bacterium]